MNSLNTECSPKVSIAFEVTFRQRSKNFPDRTVALVPLLAVTALEIFDVVDADGIDAFGDASLFVAYAPLAHLPDRHFLAAQAGVRVALAVVFACRTCS